MKKNHIDVRQYSSYDIRCYDNFELISYSIIIECMGACPSSLSLYHSSLFSFNIYCIAQTLWAYLWDESTCDLHREILYRHKTLQNGKIIIVYERRINSEEIKHLFNTVFSSEQSSVKNNTCENVIFQKQSSDCKDFSIVYIYSNDIATVIAVNANGIC